MKIHFKIHRPMPHVTAYYEINEETRVVTSLVINDDPASSGLLAVNKFIFESFDGDVMNVKGLKHALDLDVVSLYVPDRILITEKEYLQAQGFYL